MRRGLGIVALAALLMALPLAAAQEHAHAGDAMLVIAHDGPPDGRAVVGNVAHFAAILLGKNGQPAFHHNLQVTVALNGATLFATTPGSGHDYDGVFGFDVVFTVPGAYSVTAVSDGDQPAIGTFNGTVVPLEQAIAASLQMEAPADLVAGAPATFTYQIVDAQGQIIPHTDALVEVVDASGHILYRVHTHTHEVAQALTLALPKPGAYALRATGYTAFPTANAPAFAAFQATQMLSVAPGLPSASPPAPQTPVLNMVSLDPQAPDVTLNRVEMGEGSGEYVLLATYDPYTVVGPFSQARLSAVVLNATTMQPVQHVNFKATLVDSLGRILLQSESLHEYDGVLEVLVGDAPIGQYHLAVEAARGTWIGKAEAHYAVAPPVAALSAGPQIVETQGFDQIASGAPAELDVFIHDLAGMPFAHGEVDVQVVPATEGAAPILATKLHTHDDGHFPFTLAFPTAGRYEVRLAPFALEARPTPAFYLGSPGVPTTFQVQVAEGPGLPLAAPLQATRADTPPAPVPGLEAGLGALALAGVALALRRSR